MIRRMEEHDRPHLDVARSERDGVQLVELAGELDLDSIAELDAVLAAASAGAPPRVCLDLTGLAFIDSSGLAAVIRAHIAAAESGGGLIVVAPAGTVRRTIETSGLMDMLSVVDSRDAALADLA
jgi:stage II sporulation protein AA (anti-sigma F factor antagonist)